MSREVQYARSGDVNIAYQVVGAGPLDLVLVPGFVSHLELDWEEPHREPYLGLHAWYKELIALRRARPELTDPRLDRVHANFDEDARWLLVRRGRLRIAANLGAKAVRLPLGQRGTGVLAASSPGVTIKQDMVTMPPATFAVIETRAPSPGLSRQRGERCSRGEAGDRDGAGDHRAHPAHPGDGGLRGSRIGRIPSIRRSKAS